MENQKKQNTNELVLLFQDYLNYINYKGICGVAKFSVVYDNLMKEQKNYLKLITINRFDQFMKSGSIICLGIAYHLETIECINIEKNKRINKGIWNKYAKEYNNLNKLLNKISKKIADKYNGIAIPPTTETPSENISNVTEYYSKTISHRVIAEHAGIGWRGKNELIITKNFGPAIRLVSILVSFPLIQNDKIESQCGSCNACLDVCPILSNKSQLNDYRENCRLFINSLGLEYDVCGKCIKACVKEIKSKFK